jgi:tetrahydromethanopterin S-methyltransferase subunit C
MKIDKQKVKIDFLRDRYKNYFIVLMAIIGGSVGILFQISIKKLPLWTLSVSLIGLIFVLIILNVMKDLKNDIIKYINELESM